MSAHVPSLTPRSAANVLLWWLILSSAWEGIGYLAGGKHVASTPSYALVERYPGGVQSFAVAWLVLSMAMLYGALTRWPPWLQKVLIVGMCVDLLWTFATTAVWLMVGIVSWGAPARTGAAVIMYVVLALAGRFDGEGGADVAGGQQRG